MSTAAQDRKPYQFVGPPVHETRWDAQLQASVRGWAIRAKWLPTGAVVNVFVPDTDDLVTTADTLIRFQGAQLDALAKLSA